MKVNEVFTVVACGVASLIGGGLCLSGCTGQSTSSYSVGATVSDPNQVQGIAAGVFLAHADSKMKEFRKAFSDALAAKNTSSALRLASLHKAEVLNEMSQLEKKDFSLHDKEIILKFLQTQLDLLNSI